MKNKIVLIAVLGLLALAGCEPKQDVIGEGTLANPYFQGSVMEFLRSDPYNFDWTVKMIERAGLVDLFEGDVDTLPEITFLAFTKFSVMRYVYDNKKDDVEQLGVEECREMVLRHVIEGKVIKDDIAYRDMAYAISAPEQKGGTDIMTIGGSKLRFYLIVDDYGGVPGAGAVHMQIFSMDVMATVPLSTVGIIPLNGMIHSLSDGYSLGRI